MERVEATTGWEIYLVAPRKAGMDGILARRGKLDDAFTNCIEQQGSRRQDGSQEDPMTECHTLEMPWRP